MEAWEISHCPVSALRVLCTPLPIKDFWYSTPSPSHVSQLKLVFLPTLGQVGLHSQAPVHT